MEIERYDIVCASVLPCDDPAMPCTQASLLRRFARCGHRVLFINPPLRWLADYRTLHARPGERAKATTLWHRAPQQLEPNFWVYTPPPMLPMNRVRSRASFLMLLRLNRGLYRAAVRAAARALHLRHPLLWIALEPYLGGGLIGGLRERAVVYHCTDNLLAYGVYNRALGAIERRVARQADLVICTSAELRRLMQRHNSRTFCVANGTELAAFARARTPLAEPAELGAIPRPRAIYVGYLEGRVDLDLLRAVAAQAPDVSLVLVGPALPAVAAAIAAWGAPNVFLLGPKPHEAIPAYLRWADVALLPHRINELTRSMDPLKLYEYLAAGKPVVSTPLEPLLPFQEVVTLAATPEQFVAGMRAALAGDSAAQLSRRIAVAERSDWEARAATIVGLIARTLALSDGRPPGATAHAAPASEE